MSGSTLTPPLPILMYHSVPLHRASAPGHVPINTLRRQLSLLTHDRWQLMGVTAALAAREEDPTARIVGVTFDDGYDDLTRAAEVVSELGGGCTAYIVTDFADRGPGSGFLGWSAICDLHRAGVEIGSHTCSHRQLDIAPARVTRSELADSRRRLEDALGAQVLSTSYPHGYWSRPVLRIAGDVGYQSGCCVGRRTARGEDPLALPRLEPRAGMSDRRFMRMIEHGEPGVSPRVKRLAGPAWRVARRSGLKMRRGAR